MTEQFPNANSVGELSLLNICQMFCEYTHRRKCVAYNPSYEHRERRWRSFYYMQVFYICKCTLCSPYGSLFTCYTSINTLTLCINIALNALSINFDCRLQTLHEITYFTFIFEINTKILICFN